MYEMQGTSPGLAASRSASRLAFPARTRRPPEPGTRVRLRLPCSSHVPESPPGQCPFLTVKVFLLPRYGTAQDPRRIFFWLFCCPHAVHRIWLVIRIPPRFSTVFYTGHPQA